MGARFEDRLLVELTGLLEPADAASLPPARRRRTALGVAGAIVVTGAAAAVIVPTMVLGGHGRRAYAVTRMPAGAVALTVSTGVQPRSVRQALARAGVSAVVVPLDYHGRCSTEPNLPPTPAGPPVTADGPDGVVIHPDRLPPGGRLVVQVPVAGAAFAPIRFSVNRAGRPAC